ncbi:MAG TPA: amidohydrolase, partial [Burkholderiales bacterium]|nr:amidohydrolase [Burkholderiales bacterium]
MRRSLAAPLALLMVLSLLPGPLTPASPVEKRIKALANGLAPELIALREDIHAHPELGLDLTRTSALVVDHFHRLGLDVRTG